jgi:hypothetical protein
VVREKGEREKALKQQKVAKEIATDGGTENQNVLRNVFL